MKNFEIGAIVLGLVAGTVQAEPVQWSVADGGNGHWYEGFAEADEISFEEANAHAISKGGYLASVTTEGESNFIKSNVANNTDLWVYDVNECLCGGPFIGGYRNSTEDWQWTDESSWKWTSWHPGNPDGEFEDSQSVRLWDFSSKNWVDHRNAGETGSVVISYIVEWDSLPVQWRIEDGGNGHWYQLVVSASTVTWNEANAGAQSEGGYLATTTSGAENQWIYDTFNLDDYASYWETASGTGPALGAIWRGELAGYWEWNTGETWDYENWRNGQDQPNPPDADWGMSYSTLAGVPTPSNLWQHVPVDGGIVHVSYVIEFTTLPGSALGACCLDGLCITTSAADCSGNSGSWGGADSSCADFDCPENCPSDVNGDGQTDVADLLLIISAWGACP